VHCAQPDGAIRAQIKYIQIELTSDLHGHHRFIVVVTHAGTRGTQGN